MSTPKVGIYEKKYVTPDTHSGGWPIFHSPQSS